jgi:hypothetical protein
MTQIILHKNDTGGVALCIPTPEALETYTITEIALKDTPTGEPFWIVDESQVSNDHTFFNAWELDTAALGEPTGIGMNYEDWEKEYKK